MVDGTVSGQVVVGGIGCRDGCGPSCVPYEHQRVGSARVRKMAELVHEDRRRGDPINVPGDGHQRACNRRCQGYATICIRRCTIMCVGGCNYTSWAACSLMCQELQPYAYSRIRAVPLIFVSP